MPLKPESIAVVKATAPVVAEHALEITSLFYKTMFQANPEVLHFFNRSHQKQGRQPRALADSVIAYATHIDDLGALGPLVEKIAARHVALSIKPEHYQIVHDNLMVAIGKVLGDAVTPEIGAGWSNAVMSLAEICIGAEEEHYKAAEARKGGWRYERAFKVSSKETVAEDTVQFRFEAADGYKDGYEFVPGQYLTVRVPNLGAPRHYTITSTPLTDPFFEITTRLVEGGQLSSHMHKTMQVGDEVLLGVPQGVYVATEGEKPAVLVSAGVGETPMLAFLRQLQASGRVKAAYHVDVSEKRHPCKAAFEEAKLPFYETWYTGEQGRPDLDAMADKLVGAAGVEADYFVCGPTEFMNGMEEALRKREANAVHMEVFGTGSVKTNHAANVEETPKDAEGAVEVAEENAPEKKKAVA